MVLTSARSQCIQSILDSLSTTSWCGRMAPWELSRICYVVECQLSMDADRVVLNPILRALCCRLISGCLTGLLWALILTSKLNDMAANWTCACGFPVLAGSPPALSNRIYPRALIS